MELSLLLMSGGELYRTGIDAFLREDNIMKQKVGHKMEERSLKYHTRQRKIFLLFGFLICFLLGIWVGFMWKKQHTVLEGNAVQYGIAEQNLNVQSVEWKNYPSYWELSFVLSGNISFWTKNNDTILLKHLTNADAFMEIDRQHNVSSNGSDLLYYDYAAYKLDSGVIVVNIPKRYDDNIITYTISNSYYLEFSGDDIDYIAGCIHLLDTDYVPWTQEEAMASAVNLDAYLSAFTLSHTYANVSPLQQEMSKEGICLKQEGENYFSASINNNTEADWQYEAGLPHIELWYKGVWIELNSPYDNNLTTRMLEPEETQYLEIPETALEQYPTLLPGIYRLVIYGENEEFVVSDTFFINIVTSPLSF